MSAGAALFLASACGATLLVNEAEPSEPESETESEPAEPEYAAGEEDAYDDLEPADEAENVDTEDQQSANERKVRARTDPDPPSDTEDESGWSPETAQTIIERARRQLTRRCQTGSEAACRAIPNLDKCVDLQRASCARLGELFASGAAGVSRNPAHARDFWWRACDIASADCLRYGKLLFDIDGLESREAVAHRFFQFGCRSDFQLCESAGRFYQHKKELTAARKFFDLGCAAGQEAACQAKK